MSCDHQVALYRILKWVKKGSQKGTPNGSMEYLRSPGLSQCDAKELPKGLRQRKKKESEEATALESVDGIRIRGMWWLFLCLPSKDGARSQEKEARNKALLSGEAQGESKRRSHFGGYRFFFLRRRYPFRGSKNRTNKSL